MTQRSTSDFLFELPEELIAQTPLDDRSASRMLILGKDGGICHGRFRNIANELTAGDCIVLNETKVIPARLRGVKETGRAQIELLLLRRLDAGRWETLARPGRKIRPGDRLVFGGDSAQSAPLAAVVEEILEDGNRIVRFEYEGLFEQILDRLGEAPLPPYIREKLEDTSRYQTVYAKHEGSAAAPTAGLHFTKEVFADLTGKGITIARITLHVGLGTFRPVTAEEIEKQHMHAEEFSISPETAAEINAIRANGGRIIAIGTTSVRVLESCVTDDGKVFARTGETDIFLYPPYKFRAVDGLITNFHLPESTLVMLVSCLAGRENILNAYNEAVKEKYRFFSFGDAMLIIGSTEDEK